MSIGTASTDAAMASSSLWSTNMAIGRAIARLTAKYSSRTSRDGLPRSIRTTSYNFV